ncbi:3D domain-containing protein [Sporolactobacillus vineae]|uniref:3D domain-containing protein n=1 Tax=Sporolactobacillus vineae TaxID=444463 RepID=UPI00028A2C5F|nr:3D domain-containing protein [Sporolactobacillus vineae]
MLRKKLGTAASVMAAIGMVFPMTVGFTQTDGSSSALAGAQHRQVYKVKANRETADDFVNDIQNAKVNKYQTLIEMKIQESRQSSEPHKAAVKHTVKKADVRRATNEQAKPVVKKTPKPVVHAAEKTNKVTTDKDDSQVKPEVTVRKQQAAVPVKKTATVKAAKKVTVTKKAARTDSESAEAKAAAAPAVQKKVPTAAKPVSRQTTVKPAAEHHTASTEESQHSVAPRQQRTYQAPESAGKAVQSTGETTQSTQSSNKAAQPVSSSSKTFTLTAYSLKGTTATGVNLTANPRAKVIAVDPNVIPLHSKVTIPGLGTYTAEDTGGAIQGNRIDVHMSSTQEALNFGVRTVPVTVQR